MSNIFWTAAANCCTIPTPTRIAATATFRAVTWQAFCPPSRIDDCLQLTNPVGDFVRYLKSIADGNVNPFQLFRLFVDVHCGNTIPPNDKMSTSIWPEQILFHQIYLFEQLGKFSEFRRTCWSVACDGVVVKPTVGDEIGMFT